MDSVLGEPLRQLGAHVPASGERDERADDAFMRHRRHRRAILRDAGEKRPKPRLHLARALAARRPEIEACGFHRRNAWHAGAELGQALALPLPPIHLDKSGLLNSIRNSEKHCRLAGATERTYPPGAAGDGGRETPCGDAAAPLGAKRQVAAALEAALGAPCRGAMAENGEERHRVRFRARLRTIAPSRSAAGDRS